MLEDGARLVESGGGRDIDQRRIGSKGSTAWIRKESLIHGLERHLAGGWRWTGGLLMFLEARPRGG